MIRKVVEEVLEHYPVVICVNDGSTDNSASEIIKTGALLIEHPMNIGQGAALQTGLEMALRIPGIQYFATFDADGQHDINDVKHMLETLKHQNLDIVLGSRFLGKAQDINPTKKLLLRLAIKFTNIFSDVKLTDTHNGLRVFNRNFAQQLDITMTGMAHASEIIDKVGRDNWHYQEVPVTVHYTDYSRNKGQSALNSVNILIELLLNRSQK